MKTQHDILMEDPEFRRLLSIEALVAEASETIARLMAEKNVTKADLARRLNKSRAWVTQLLSGKTNMTVRTLAEVAYALGAEIKLEAQSPASKASGKTSAPTWQPMVFKIDNYLVESPIASEELFRLETGRMKPSNKDLAAVKLDPSNSEYAA